MNENVIFQKLSQLLATEFFIIENSDFVVVVVEVFLFWDRSCELVKTCVFYPGYTLFGTKLLAERTSFAEALQEPVLVLCVTVLQL